MEETTTNPTDQTREALVNDLNQLKDNAVQVAQDVRDHASAHLDQTKQRVSDTLSSAHDSITSRPWTMLGVGFAVGFFLGWRSR